MVKKLSCDKIYTHTPLEKCLDIMTSLREQPRKHPNCRSLRNSENVPGFGLDMAVGGVRLCSAPLVPGQQSSPPPLPRPLQRHLVPQQLLCLGWVVDSSTRTISRRSKSCSSQRWNRRYRSKQLAVVLVEEKRRADSKYHSVLWSNCKAELSDPNTTR